MKKSLTYLILFILFASYSDAQRYYATNQYIYDLFLMNPADAGSNTDCMIMNAYYHRQWFGVDMAPTTQMFTFQTPIIEGLGSGSYIYNDRNGNNKKIGLNQAFSTEITLQETMRGYTGLQFGLAFQLEQTSIDKSGFTFDDSFYDPVINDGDLSGIGFNAAAGFILSHNKHHIGASATNIFPQNNPMYNLDYEPKLPVDFHIHSGTLIKIPDFDIFLEPKIYYRFNSISDSRLDINLKMSMPTPDPHLAFWGLLAHRRTMDHRLGKDLALATTIGLNYHGINFGIEYHHGLTSAQSHYGGGIHLIVGYAICKSGRPKTLPCQEGDIMLQSIDGPPKHKTSIFRKLF